MASTTFVDKVTVINTNWLNEVNGVVWTLFGGSSSASAARTSLGLGTIATQAANNVAITGGTITGLGTPLPVASGGTGVTTSTGTGNNVLSASPTLSGTITVTGNVAQSTSTAGDFTSLESTASSTENALRVNSTQTTSGVGLKLSNSGHNKQVSFRGDSGGGLTVYVNQTAAGSTTSGTTAITITSAGATTFASSVAAASVAATGAVTAATVASTGAITENSTRVFSYNSAGKPANQAFNGVNKVFTFAHGLGAVPTFFMAYLKCIQVDNGYAVNDVILLPYTSVSGAGTNVFADGTNVYVAVTGNISMVSKTGTGPSNLQSTGAYWEIYIRAWA